MHDSAIVASLLTHSFFSSAILLLEHVQ